MLDDEGRWWARRVVKPGKATPANFVPVETDDVTGKTVGWEPIEQSPFAKFHAEALGDGPGIQGWQPGTYELIGPKINGNPERHRVHVLVRHGAAYFSQVRPPRPVQLIAQCRWLGWEGIVWHHPDGRMAKLKVSDYRRSKGATA